MFAGRTNWELTQNKITAILEEFKRKGTTVFDLTESNPTRCGFVYPEKELQSALLNPANMRYIPATKGMLSAREAVAAYYKGQRIDISPEQIFLTSSTSEGYSFLFRLLADPGETMLFPAPSYPLFEFLVGLNDLEMQYYPLQYQNKWAIDFPALRKLITPHVRGIILVNPNNPTGSYIKRDEVAALNAICREHQLPIISDEVFYDYTFDPHQHFPSLANNDDQLSFVLGGLSKTLGLPQMKLSWIVVNGPEHLIAQTMERLEIIADTYLSVNTPVQNALPLWMQYRQAIQKQIMMRVLQNREYALRQFGDEAVCLNADGGWYIVLKLKQELDEELLVEELLSREQVYVHPGYFFNFESGSHVILSLLSKPEVFQEGVSRIRQYLKNK